MNTHDRPAHAVPPEREATGAHPTAPLWPSTQPIWRAPGPDEPPGARMPGPPAFGPVPPAFGQVPPAHPVRGGGVGRGLGLLVAAVALAVGSGLAGGYVAHRMDGEGAATSTTTASTTRVVDRSSLASIAAAVKPSVVDISTGEGEGSGVVVTADGAILTNNHVVAGARNLQVTFSNGKTARATVVGTDPAGDLAVIKAQSVSGLTPAKFGDSDALQVGDTVLALGSPLGLRGSVTAGIVSALHRTIDEGDGAGGRGRSIGDAIQTDAAINPGNSGGALVNTAGEVIGINTAIATSGQGQGNIGLGFAIPSKKARASADALLKGGKVGHPYLGVRLADADGGGAMLVAVDPGGPAEKAGLQRGDVVTKAGGKAVNNANELVGAIQAVKAGDQLPLTITRDGSQRDVTVTLGETP